MRLVLVSDTHLRHPEVPAGDLLIHAGDLTGMGTRKQLRKALAWLKSQPHPHKIAIAGNHDICLEAEPALAELFAPEVRYLRDEETEIGGLRLWGSPWTPWFHDWAFNIPRGAALREVWSRVPAGLDVLVTHGPPAGILDRTHDGLEVGCEDLRRMVVDRPPRLHVFGHIHEAYGRTQIGATTFVNASICDHVYRVAHDPMVVDLEPQR